MDQPKGTADGSLGHSGSGSSQEGEDGVDVSIFKLACLFGIGASEELKARGFEFFVIRLIGGKDFSENPFIRCSCGRNGYAKGFFLLKNLIHGFDGRISRYIEMEEVKAHPTRNGAKVRMFLIIRVFTVPCRHIKEGKSPSQITISLVDKSWVYGTASWDHFYHDATRFFVDDVRDPSGYSIPSATNA